VLGLLSTARDLHAATDGAFDLAVGALLACWHHAGMAEGAGAVPDDQAIATARAACGMGRNVALDAERGTVRFARSGVRLDPGAIGKGWALDRAAAALREAGVASALLHGGTSTAYGLGQPPDQPTWRVAVRDPRGGDRVVATAGLRDTALSVSAVHGRSFTAGGRRYGHVIDPRSGQPVQGTLLAAVVHPSALLSDALSTALLVLGRAGLGMLAPRYPEAGFLVVDDAQAGVETAGPGFAPAGADAAEGQPPPVQGKVPGA
jgi:thiamine biosynthesis lipoprotein